MRLSMFFIILLFGIIVSLFVHRMQEMNNVIENEKIKSHKIMDILPMIILFLDTEGNVSCVNKKILEITGYDECQICGSKWFSLLLPEDYRSEMRSYWNQFLSEELDSVTDLEVPIICADGSKKTVLWNAVSFIEDGNLLV